MFDLMKGHDAREQYPVIRENNDIPKSNELPIVSMFWAKKKAYIVYKIIKSDLAISVMGI